MPNNEHPKTHGFAAVLTLIGMVLLVIAVIALVYAGVSESRAFRACERAGGHPVSEWSGVICYAPGILIPEEDWVH